MSFNDNFLPFSGLEDHELTELLCENDGSLARSIEEFSSIYLNVDCMNDSYNETVSPDNLSSLFRTNKSDYYFCDNSLKNSINVSGKNCLNIMCYNVRSLPSKFEEFCTDFLPCNFDIVMLNETWLVDGLENLYSISNYDAFFKNRFSRGGGLAVYIHEKLHSCLVDNLTNISNSLESLFITFECLSKSYLVGNIYRPPGSSINDFLHEFSALMHTIKNDYPSHLVCLGGDINIDLLRVDSNSKVQEYLNVMLSYGFQPLIKRPTRVTSTSMTLIDHLWTNCGDFLNSGIILSRISDHFPVFATFELSSNIEKSDSVEIYYRDLGASSRAKFSEELSFFDWGEFLDVTEPQHLYTNFQNVIRDLFDRNFPLRLKRKKAKDFNKPYITPEILELIKDKRRLQKLSLKYPLTYGMLFRASRNRVNSAIRSARRNHYKNLFHKYDGQPKKFWGVINDILGRGGRSEECIKKLKTMDGNYVVRDEEIADTLNNYFSKVGARLAEKFRVNDSSFENFLQRLYSYKFEFQPVTLQEVKDTVFSIRDTGPGEDQIPMFIFKENIDALSFIIAKIVNTSFELGNFPAELCIAKVKCIFKSGALDDPANYRPISILPAFSKILEKLAFVRLFKYFDSINFFSGAQFGFRPGLSTEYAIHCLVDKIHLCFDSGQLGLGLFLDLTKAFDSLDRRVLLRKLWY